jgi:hypothetical protein
MAVDSEPQLDEGNAEQRHSVVVGRCKVSNQTVLVVTTILFAAFVTAELVGALVSSVFDYYVTDSI